MPKRFKRKAVKNKGTSGARFAGAYEQLRKVVLEQERTVSLRRLKEAIEEYNQWQVFQLWLRAVVDAARNLPPVVEQEIQSRIPGFLKDCQAEMRAAMEQDRPGGALWNLVGSWTNATTFLHPRSEGWMEALIFFASRNMVYIKAWSHWDTVNLEWQANPPAEWPSYEQWQQDVAALSRLSNPDSEQQLVLNAILSVPVAEWERLLSAFLEMTVFAVWMELMLDLEGPQSGLLSEELSKRYPEFSFGEIGFSPGEAVREFLTWTIDHKIGVENEDLVGALNWHIQNGPEIDFMQIYASDCHAAWSKEYPRRLPGFEDWRTEAAK
jgi:hypothetical protein